MDRPGRTGRARRARAQAHAWVWLGAIRILLMIREPLPHALDIAGHAEKLPSISTSFIVHNIKRAHNALRTNGFHMNGRNTERKASVRIAQYRTVKIDIHEDCLPVQRIYVEETVERVNIAKGGIRLALTVNGVGTTSRRRRRKRTCRARFGLRSPLLKMQSSGERTCPT